MDEMDKVVFEEYKLARNSIQLTDAYIIDIKMNRLADQWGTRSKLSVGLAKRQEYITEGHAVAYLNADISVVDEDTSDVILNLLITCRGEFKSVETISQEKLTQFVDIQTVPQLFPYVRGAVSTLSAMMAIPVINLPTIDVIKSIRINRDNNQQEELREND